MKNIMVSLVILALLNLTGCKHEPATRYICLLDISASIYPEEVDREFDEMQSLVAQMHREDKLLVYPITGNARNDLPGHIIQLTAPTSRTAYDSDLSAFRKDANSHIETMRAWAKANLAGHTDILGTLEVASQEVPHGSKANTKLIIMSDFLEDESRYNFITNHSLTSTASARALAESEATRHQLNFLSATIHLTRLHSREVAALTPSRMDAVDAFWGELLRHGKERPTP